MAILVPFVTRCGAAALCGALIGIERERKAKPAGFRTNSLICLGSSMYMSVGLLLVTDGNQAGSDPARIAAQVVTGIGFLGAGNDADGGDDPDGGGGFPVVAFVATLMVLATLALLQQVERRMNNEHED